MTNFDGVSIKFGFNLCFSDAELHEQNTRQNAYNTQIPCHDIWINVI
jgi:hypothetical protein